MGNYIDADDLIGRLNGTTLQDLLDTENTSGDIAQGLMDSIIERAEGVVDGYISTRYTTPVGSGALVQEWALRCAMYELYARSMCPEIPEKIKDAYKDALAMLDKVAAGKLLLPGTTATPTAADGLPIVSADTQEFSSSNMGWM